MINMQFFICVVALLSFISSRQIDCLLEGSGAEEERELEIKKKMAIENIKSQLLQQLGKKEPLTFPNISSRQQEEIVEMLIKRDEEEEERIKRQNELADLVVLPIDKSLQCQWYNTSCKRFEYSLFPDVIFSTAKLWIHKLEFFPPENLTVSALCSSSKEEIKTSIGPAFLEEDKEEKWLIYRLPVLQNLTYWQENINCEIEITGATMNESSHNRPFLEIKGAKPRIQKRQTRENPVLPQTCDVVPFNVSFKDIGFGDWIISPTSFEAKFCSGTCRGVQSHYENLMSILFSNNETLQKTYGRCWATCCRPQSYEHMNLIHWEHNNTIAHRNMTNMIVKSCSCS